MGVIKKILPLSVVERWYLDRGAFIGDALSYSYMGKAVGFDRMLKRLVSWEYEYARRGFMPVSLDDFVAFGGYGENISKLLRVPHNGKPVYHAREFLNEPDDMTPLIDMKALMEGKAQIVNVHEDGRVERQYFDINKSQE